MKKRKAPHFDVGQKPPTQLEEMEGLMHVNTGMPPMIMGKDFKPQKGTQVLTSRSPGKQERITKPKGK